ncbi:MAG: hypothetical protein WCI27_03965, partial [Candidatus Omnitrophota bacterium]
SSMSILMMMNILGFILCTIGTVIYFLVRWWHLRKQGRESSREIGYFNLIGIASFIAGLSLFLFWYCPVCHLASVIFTLNFKGIELAFLNSCMMSGLVFLIFKLKSRWRFLLVIPVVLIVALYFLQMKKTYAFVNIFESARYGGISSEKFFQLLKADGRGYEWILYRSLAKNTGSDAKILRFLFEQKNFDIDRLLFDNPSTPEDIMNEFFKGQSQYTLAMRSSLDDTTKKYLISQMLLRR